MNSAKDTPGRLSCPSAARFSEPFALSLSKGEWPRYARFTGYSARTAGYVTSLTLSKTRFPVPILPHLKSREYHGAGKHRHHRGERRLRHRRTGKQALGEGGVVIRRTVG